MAKESIYKSVLKTGLGTLAGAILVALLWGIFSYAKLPNQNKKDINNIKQVLVNIHSAVRSNHEILLKLIDKE